MEAKLKVMALRRGEYFPWSSHRYMKTGTRMRRRRVRMVGKVRSFSGFLSRIDSQALCL